MRLLQLAKAESSLPAAMPALLTVAAHDLDQHCLQFDANGGRTCRGGACSRELLPPLEEMIDLLCRVEPGALWS